MSAPYSTDKFNPYTTLLRLPVPRNNWAVPCKSKFYHKALKAWFDHYGLAGTGLLIGEVAMGDAPIKQTFKQAFPTITEVLCVDFTAADMSWDITYPAPVDALYDWVICQAVLEHVVDPIAAIQNMLNVLKPGGKLYIHTHLPEFAYHKYPIDCYRFYPDVFKAISTRLGQPLLDYYTSLGVIAVVYERTA